MVARARVEGSVTGVGGAGLGAFAVALGLVFFFVAMVIGKQLSANEREDSNSRLFICVLCVHLRTVMPFMLFSSCVGSLSRRRSTPVRGTVRCTRPWSP